MRVLVSGGAGFIGSHLAERLLRTGHEVIIVDNFFTGTKANLSHLTENPALEILRHDITFPLYVEVDAIYNLASAASPKKYAADPVQTMKTSVVGAINLLGLAKRLKVPILQASTSEVYGDPQQNPQVETYWGNVNPIGLRSCYDEGKRAAETLFSDYRREHGVDTKIVRIFNTYGPRLAVDDGRVVSNFVVQAIRGEPLTVYGDGSQTRSLCYVDDLVDGLVKMMSSDASGPINLGNPNEVSMLELAQIVTELVGSDSNTTFLPLPSDDPRVRKPDITLAREALSWSPTTDLRAGLLSTIEYFRQRLQSS